MNCQVTMCKLTKDYFIKIFILQHKLFKCGDRLCKSVKL
jgi:hypothetical protein